VAENIDFQFLGEQIKRLQSDVRDVKARVLLLESDQGEMREDFRRLEGKVDRLETRIDVLVEHTDDRFDRIDHQFVQLFPDAEPAVRDREARHRSPEKGLTE
jgi:predicted nuclease with TOPRIM domain